MGLDGEDVESELDFDGIERVDAEDRQDASSTLDAQQAGGSSIVNELIGAEAIHSIDKMAEVLVHGPDTERDYVLFELNQLLEQCPEETMKTLMPVICKHVHEWSLNVQFRVGEGMVQVVRLNLDPTLAWQIAAAAFAVVALATEHFPEPSGERESFFDIWGGIIVDSLTHVEWNPMTNWVEVTLDFIDQCSERQDVPEQRKIAARLLAPLAGSFSQETVTQLLLPRSLQLHADTDVLVRGTVASSLADIGERLPLRKVENEVWPALLVLLEDVDSRIRASALRSIGRILTAQRERPRFDPENTLLFNELVPPVFVRWSIFARKAAAHDQRLVDDDTYLLLEVVAEVFGELLYSTSLCKEAVYRKTAIKAFLGMATCNGPLIRRNCAFNTPGVALTLHEKYPVELSSIVECLTRDTDEEVRWILAVGFHETLRVLAPTARHDKLLQAFGALSKDSHSTVRKNVLEHFSKCVSILTKDGDINSIKKLTPILQDIGDIKSLPWQSHERFANEVDKCAHLLPPNLLIDVVQPALFSIVQGANRPVKRACITAIIRCIRYIPDIVARDLAVSQFWAKCLEGNYAMRLTFLWGGEAALSVFSQDLFRQLFASRLLLCTKDRIVSVRFALVSLLPSMAVSCARLGQFGTALNVLRRDPDPEIRATMRKFHQLAGRKMQEDAKTLDLDSQKLREEARFFGQTRRVNAMKPSMITLVKTKVGPKKSRDETPPETPTHESDHQGDSKLSNGPQDATKGKDTRSRSANVNSRSSSFAAERDKSFGSLPDLKSTLESPDLSPGKSIPKHRRSKSLKSFTSEMAGSSSPTNTARMTASRTRLSLDSRKGVPEDAKRVAKQLPGLGARKSNRLSQSPGPQHRSDGGKALRVDTSPSPGKSHGRLSLRRLFHRGQ